MGLLIKPTGIQQRITPANGKAFSLRELQLHIGGYIERIELNNGCAMYVDEEGVLKNLPYNHAATEFLEKALATPCACIRGNAVVLQYREEK